MKLSTLFISLFVLLSTGMSAAAQSTKIPAADKPGTSALPVGTFSEIKGDHVKGQAGAPVTMIIFASVTCPHCAHWFESVWPELNTEYVDNGSLRIVFRELPTAPADFAQAGFMLANCAPEEQYFDMIEYQMKEQDAIIGSIKAGTHLDTYLDIAKRAGLENKEQMFECFANEAGLARIDKANQLAGAAGLTGVPFFIIDGKVFKENPDMPHLRKHLDGLLARGYTPAPAK